MNPERCRPGQHCYRVRGRRPRPKDMPIWRLRTFEGRETSIEDEFKIAKLSLGQNDSWETLGLSCELLVSWQISGNEIPIQRVWLA